MSIDQSLKEIRATARANRLSKPPVISYPHFGEYNVAINILLSRIFHDAKVIEAPPMTKKTLAVGTLNSPEFVCVPYKYTMGNYIEAVAEGANVLFQAAGGCRFGYYGELQEQTLKDLGHEVRFVSLLNESTFKAKRFYVKMVEAGCTQSYLTFLRHFLFAVRAVLVIDRLGRFYRANAAFEKEKGTFKKARVAMYKEITEAKSFFALPKIEKKYFKIYKSILLNKPEKPLKVLIVGEIYCLLEPSSNHYLEDNLLKNNIEVHRHVDLEKGMLHNSYKDQAKMAGKTDGYIKYVLEADGTFSISSAVEVAKAGFDGIVHVKPFGCIPEISAMPPLIQISSDYKLPVLYFSFDSHTSETGIQTRLEAFVDMLAMKKDAST